MFKGSYKLNVFLRIALVLGMLVTGRTHASQIDHVCFQQTSLADLDSLNNENYKKWVMTKDSQLLEVAKETFVKNFELLPLNKRFDYGIKVAHLLVKNKEEGPWVKQWYENALSYYDFKYLRSEWANPERKKEKYGLVIEFTQLYSKRYGKCEETVEVLRVYKTEYSFRYVKYNRGSEKTDKIWLRLVREDQYLSWVCEEQ